MSGVGGIIDDRALKRRCPGVVVFRAGDAGVHGTWMDGRRLVQPPVKLRLRSHSDVVVEMAGRRNKSGSLRLPSGDGGAFLFVCV